MVRRLIEHQEVDAACLQQREPCAGALPRRKLINRTTDVVGFERELRQQRAYLGRCHLWNDRFKSICKRRSAGEQRARLIDLAHPDAHAEARGALVWRLSAEQCAQQSRLVDVSGLTDVPTR